MTPISVSANVMVASADNVVIAPSWSYVIATVPPNKSVPLNLALSIKLPAASTASSSADIAASSPADKVSAFKS